MEKTLSDWLARSFIAICVLVLLGIGAAACFFVGFAWSIIICAVVAGIVYRAIPAGPYGEGSYLTIASWILLVVGVAVGLVLRLVLQ